MARRCAVSRQLSTNCETLELLNFEFKAFGVHFGKDEQILRQARQAAGMFQNDFEKAGAVLWIVDGAGEERFGEALNGGEREF